MDFTKENDDDDEEAGGENERFFIEGSSYSESEEEQNSCKAAVQRSREGSPPLLLAFSGTSGQVLHDSSPSPDLQEDDGDSDQYIEDWMIVGGEEQEGDSSILLNLSYRNSISDDDSEDEG